MEKDRKFLYLSEQDVQTLLTQEDAIAAAEEAFRSVGNGAITIGRMTLMTVDPAEKNNFHIMPAVMHERHVAGMKWIGTFGAPLPGYPFSHGNLVILSSTDTGSPLAVVGATGITAMRTAGGHGVVQAKLLANPDPESLSVFGCGVQAKSGICGFLQQFPSIKQVRIFSRSEGPIAAVREQWKTRAEVVSCRSAEEALEESDLVLMASGAWEPLLWAKHLRPGMTVIGIEGFRDMDPEISRRAKWYLGCRETDIDILEDPELNPDGSLSLSDVYGDVAQVLNGKCVGRENPEEIIVSTHMGMGAHDLCCAYRAYERAKEKGMGTWLEI